MILRRWKGIAAVLGVGLIGTSNSTAWALGPSFDCSKAATPGQQLICASPELSRTELEYSQAYYALRQQLGETGWQALKTEAIASQIRALQRCGIPLSGHLPPAIEPLADCLRGAYQEQRADLIRRLGESGAQEATRPLEQHVALQQRLLALGFLPSDAATDGVYGAATREAVFAWQRANNRPASGFISDADAQALGDNGTPAVAPKGTLYHAQRETLGCRDPQVIRTLINASHSQRSDQRWVASVTQAGNCTRIGTTGSWALVLQQGDLAVMTSRSPVAPPASLFVIMADFVEDQRGSAAESSQSATAPAPPINLWPPTSPNTAAAKSDISRSPVPSQPESATASGSLPNNDVSTKPSGASPSASIATTSGLQSSRETSGVEFAIAFASIILGVLGVLAWKQRSTNLALERTLRVARAEIQKNAANLRVRRLQLVQPDRYGTVDFEKWNAEKLYYLETRILPLLRAHDLERWLGEVSLKIELMIEDAAQRPIEASAAEPTKYFSNPEVFDPRMDPLDYERYCAMQLERAGWKPRLTVATGDQGADIIASGVDGKTLVVQCKLYSQPVGNDAVQQVYAARTFQSADIAVVASNQPFTRSAQQLAHVNGVRLLHHEQLCAFRG